MRLIDADELKIDYGFTWDDITPTHEEMYALIDKQPTIEPERKKGKWNHGLCSVCGYDWGKDAPIANVPPFCPNCGADMRN